MLILLVNLIFLWGFIQDKSNGQFRSQERSDIVINAENLHSFYERTSSL